LLTEWAITNLLTNGERGVVATNGYP